MPDSASAPSAQALPDDAAFSRTLRRGTWWAGLAIGLPALALLALVIYLLASGAAIEETDCIVAEAHQVQKLMIDMETGLRGFESTGDERFLEPFRQAQKEIKSPLGKLARLSAKQPGASSGLDALQREINEWQAFAAEALLPKRRSEAERDLAFQLRGKTSMDHVRSRISGLIAAGERLREKQGKARGVIRWFLFGGLLLVGLVEAPLATFWLRRLLRRVAVSYETSLDVARQRASELHVTLRSIGDAVLTTDAEGRIVFLNPVAERLMGWSTAEAAGRPLTEVFQIFHETTGAPGENPVERVLREHRVIGLANHTILRARNGTETPIEDSAAPILDDAGKVVGVVLVFHDVGVKRGIELRLQEAEWRSRTALEIGGAGSWTWEIGGDRVTGDAMVAQVFELPAESCRAGLLADTFLAKIPDLDRARLEESIRRALENGGSYETEFQVRPGSGPVRWLQARGRVETGVAGRPARLLGFLLDTTTARLAEETLSESERRFRLLNSVSETTRSLTQPKEIMAAVAQLLGEHLRVSRCAYAEVDEDGERFAILDDYTDGCVSSVGKYALSLFGSRVSAEMRASRTLVIYDLAKDLAEDSGAEAFRAIQVEAIVCCPLVRAGALRAMMAVHQTTPRAWTSWEIALVEEVVERCWAIIERARAEDEIRQRARFTSLRADIAAHLAIGGTLKASLQFCCELLVQHLGAAFTRIWTLPRGENVLTLRASAGLYTHLDGAHARIGVGDFKIGRIAKQQQPLLTNSVADDPNISDPAWAKSEGMVSFAGYPLLAEGRTVGVLAIFARQPFSTATFAELLPLAETLALYVQRKDAEDELRRATELAEHNALAMVESAERFRLLAEVVSLQVWTAGLDGALDFANQECALYFGTENLERDVLGHAWTQYVHPEDLSSAQASWQRSLASGARYEVEFRLRDWEGNYRWFLVRAQVMRGEDGAMIRWFGTNTDIHAMKLAQGEADRASRAKDEFLAALSHELRTPLTPVLMTAAALREDASLPLLVREQLAMIERNIELEARLIDDLLDLTRIARGKLDLRRQPCDAHSLIGLAIEIVRDDSQAKNILIQRDFAALRSGLFADPARFQQVIWNLLRNAVKFTPAGGTVTVATRNEDGPGAPDRLRIEIVDTGIGISPAELEKIFLPFEQGGLIGDHRFGGVGLGLAIARAIVDLHGGTIEARSEGENFGATFVVEFPGATKPPDGAQEGIASLLPHTLGSANPPLSASLRLLVVEDHEPTLQVLARLLRRVGHEVHEANNLAAAKFAAAAQSFDLVISDLGLPDGTGIELMQHLRAEHGLRGIALSGYGMEDDVARSREAGFVTHLTKPVDFHQLERALKDLHLL